MKAGLNKVLWYRDPLIWYTALMLVLLMLNNIPHVGNRYWELPNGHQLPRWHAMASIALFEMTVLIFEWNGAKVWAWVFTFFLFIVSLSQWDFEAMAPLLDSETGAVIEGSWLPFAKDMAAAVSVTLVFTIPVPIAGGKLVERLKVISHNQQNRRIRALLRRHLRSLKVSEATIEVLQSENEKLTDLESELAQAQQSLSEQKDTISYMEHLDVSLKERSVALDEAYDLIKAWTVCPYCGKQEDDPGALRSHMGKCKHNDGSKRPRTLLPEHMKENMP